MASYSWCVAEANGHADAGRKTRAVGLVQELPIVLVEQVVDVDVQRCPVVELVLAEQVDQRVAVGRLDGRRRTRWWRRQACLLVNEVHAGSSDQPLVECPEAGGKRDPVGGYGEQPQSRLLVRAADAMCSDPEKPCPRIVHRLDFDTLERRVGYILVLKRAERRRSGQRHAVDVVIDLVLVHDDPAPEGIILLENAVVLEIDARFQIVRHLRPQVGIGKERERSRSRMNAGDERLRHGWRTITLGIGAEERQAFGRRVAHRYLRRHSAAIELCGIAADLVA